METRVIRIIEQLSQTITLTHIIVGLPGLMFMAVWLYKTSLGRKALVDSAPRRNNMPVYLPFVPLFIWVVITLVASDLKKAFFADLSEPQNALADNIIFCFGPVATTIIIVYLARRHFARRLKGFGLNFKTIHKDFPAAFLNLLAIYPFVALAILATIFFGKLISGPEFHIEKHQELELIIKYADLPLRVLIFITTVLVVPIFEEMLFRGMFQTTLQSYLADSPFSERFRNRTFTTWLAIAICSLLFAAFHANTGHWPALFILSLCIGYSYEKSGSLLRPIFIHCLFNASSVIATLSQKPPV